MGVKKKLLVIAILLMAQLHIHANTKDREEFVDYSRHRILEVKVWCGNYDYLPLRSDVMIDFSSAQRKLSKNKAEKLGTAFLINKNGRVLTSWHTINEILLKKDRSRYGTGTVEDPFVDFTRSCQKENIKMQFTGHSGSINGVFDEIDNPEKIARNYDAIKFDVFSTIINIENKERPEIFCYNKDFINTTPPDGFLLKNIGFAVYDTKSKRKLPNGKIHDDHQGSVRLDLSNSMEKWSVGMSNITIKGMSGGPVVDENNLLIGLNRGFDKLDIDTSFINYVFVPIQKFRNILLTFGQDNCKKSKAQIFGKIQSRDINGKVIPLPGVEVTTRYTSNISQQNITDIKGLFSIDLSGTEVDSSDVIKVITSKECFSIGKHKLPISSHEHRIFLKCICNPEDCHE